MGVSALYFKLLIFNIKKISISSRFITNRAEAEPTAFGREVGYTPEKWAAGMANILTNLADDLFVVTNPPPFLQEAELPGQNKFHLEKVLTQKLNQ